MFKLSFRVYGILNDYLPVNMRYRFNKLGVVKNSSISNLLSLHGIPNENINLITVNNKPVSDNYIVSEGDNISIYPEFRNIDKKFLIKKLKNKKRMVKFALPNELQKLASFLINIGFDVIIIPLSELKLLSEQKNAEKRVVIIDNKLKNSFKHLKYNGEVFNLKSSDLSKQIREIMHLFIPEQSAKILSHCSSCDRKMLESERREKMFQLLNNYKVSDLCKICKKHSKSINFINYIN